MLFLSGRCVKFHLRRGILTKQAEKFDEYIRKILDFKRAVFNHQT